MLGPAVLQPGAVQRGPAHGCPPHVELHARLGAVGPAARPQLHQAAAPSLRPQLRQTTTRPGRAHGLVCRASAVVPTAEPGKTRLGFLGLGLMGRLMAANLVKAGYDVTVWNRSPGKCEELAQAGAKVGATAAEVVKQCDITFAMVSDPEACLDLALGPDGVAAGIGPGKGYVDVSTVDAETAAQVAAAVRAKGGLFLEAPVSGSTGPAAQGQLIFLTAGDEALFQASAGPLDVMGKAKFFLGEVGAGANMKLVVNMVMGTMMTAYAEGLALAEGSGLKKEDLIEVIKLGAIAAPMFALKGPTMAARSYAPAFPLKHQQKDMRLALALGDQLGQAMPTAAAANELYKEARGMGLGDNDFSAVMEAVAKQAPKQ